MIETPGTTKRLDTLLLLAQERDRIEAEIRAAVIAARADNGKGSRWASWQQIGEMLGVSAAAVQKRYAAYVQPERRRKALTSEARVETAVRWWSGEGRRIRALFPEFEAERDVERMGEEFDRTLAEGGVTPAENWSWWDVELEDGSSHGKWSHSWQEAVLGVAFFWGPARTVPALVGSPDGLTAR